MPGSRCALLAPVEAEVWWACGDAESIAASASPNLVEKRPEVRRSRPVRSSCLPPVPVHPQDNSHLRESPGLQCGGGWWCMCVTASLGWRMPKKERIFERFCSGSASSRASGQRHWSCRCVEVADGADGREARVGGMPRPRGRFRFSVAAATVQFQGSPSLSMKPTPRTV